MKFTHTTELTYAMERFCDPPPRPNSQIVSQIVTNHFEMAKGVLIGVTNQLARHLVEGGRSLIETLRKKQNLSTKKRPKQ